MTPAPEADDFFKKVTKDPWFRLGMAMLEQGGPQDRPHSVGQDIARAVEKVQGQIDGDVLRDQNRQRMAAEASQREFMDRQLRSLMGSPMVSPQMPQAPSQEMRTAPQAAFMPPPVAPRIDPVANPSSDIRMMRQPTGRLRSSAIDEQITRAAKAAGVDPLLFRSLVQSESNFNHMDPRKGGITTSEAGALGAAQLMPGTARELGVDPMDLDQNLAGGARYLAQQIKANGGNIREALRAYNAGPTGARRNLAVGGDYADTIMGRLPSPISAAAPQGLPAPAAMPMAPPQSGATQLPPELHKMFLYQAMMEGGGDSVKTVQAYYRQLGQWQTQQFTQGGNLSNQKQLEDYKFNNERRKQDDEQAFRVKQAEDEANRKPQIAYDEARAKDDAEKFGRLESSITQTEDGLFSVAQMKSMLQAGVMTGGASEQLNEFAKLAKSLTGADIDTGRADFIQSLGGQFLKALRAQQAANGTKDPNPSNADLLFDQKIIPSMQNSPEGNMLILLQMQRTFQRNRELAEAAVAFAEREGRFDSLKFRKSSEAQAVYQRYRLKPDDPQRLQKTARALMQGAQEIENEEQYNALPSGSVFISPDGQVRRKR